MIQITNLINLFKRKKKIKKLSSQKYEIKIKFIKDKLIKLIVERGFIEENQDKLNIINLKKI